MVKISKLTKCYDDNEIFKQFNLTLKKNEINCILGASGCGKTTLLNIIAGLDQAYEGTILGIDNSTFSYIFQEPRLLNWFTVYKNLKIILKNENDCDEIIDKYLNLVGLYEYKDYYPHQLSGGMKQRLSIARAFAFKSDILLMDEPFKGLDVALKNSLINAFIELWEQDKRTIIFVTHDIDEAILLGDDVYILSGDPISAVFNTTITVDKKSRNVNEGIIYKKKQLIYKQLTKDEE